MTRLRSQAARTALASAVAAGTVFALAVPAAAHVTIDPSEVPGGGYATINVKVPNERDDASTVAVELHLDPDFPMASVMPEPISGWDIEVESVELDEPLESHGNEIHEVPSKITWEAQDTEISPGMFQQFPVSVGRLPDGGEQMVLRAIQTYDSGEVVRWIDDPTDDAESPAATLTLAEDGGAPSGGADDEADAESGGAEAAEPSGDTSASDTTARVLGGIGIGTGVLGLVLGLLAGRRRTTTAS